MGCWTLMIPPPSPWRKRNGSRPAQSSCRSETSFPGREPALKIPLVEKSDNNPCSIGGPTLTSESSFWPLTSGLRVCAVGPEQDQSWEVLIGQSRPYCVRWAACWHDGTLSQLCVYFCVCVLVCVCVCLCLCWVDYPALLSSPHLEWSEAKFSPTAPITSQIGTAVLHVHQSKVR